MKKIYMGLIIAISITLISFTGIFAEDVKSYDDTKNSINSYIDSQLNNLEIDDMQEYIKESTVLEKVELKSFIKDILTGKKTILDIFDKESIKLVLFNELRSSLKITSMILVIALLSAVLKSLENSFSSGTVSKVINYIIFMSIVTLALVGFKDVLEICNNTIDLTVGLMKIIMPVLMGLLVLIGFPITSTVMNPLFIGGITFINVIFKNFVFVSIAIAFAILVVNNLSKEVKLKRLSSFIKNINLMAIGAMFTIYLGLVSIQGLYVTNVDNFAVKTAKYAVGNFIPVVGGFVSDSVDILLSSSQLIKGVFGGVGLVVLVAVCLVPVLKILSIILVYKMSSIVVEPVGEDGISSFINEVANLMIVMLACIIAVTIMFFVTVAILTSISVVAQG